MSSLSSTFSASKQIRDVVVISPDTSTEVLQAFCLDATRTRVKPNVALLSSDTLQIVLQTNSLGFKGPEPPPSRRLAVVWGDSVIWGVGESWVAGLSTFFPAYAFLNGGLEADLFPNILARAQEANQSLKIECNLLFPGWHSRNKPDQVRRLLLQAVDTLPGLVLGTMPTSLNDVVVDDLQPYFQGLDRRHLRQPQWDEDYYFWGDHPYSPKNARQLLTEIRQQNEVVREVAAAKNLPLIDLQKALKTTGTQGFRSDFFDAGHLRPAAYPRIVQIVAEGLSHVLDSTDAARAVLPAQQPAPGAGISEIADPAVAEGGSVAGGADAHHAARAGTHSDLPSQLITLAGRKKQSAVRGLRLAVYASLAPLAAVRRATPPSRGWRAP